MKTYNDLTKYEKECIKVTVCDHCNTAACWHDVFHCGFFENAGVWEVPIYYLEQLGEHCEYWEDWEDDINRYFDDREMIDNLIRASIENR